MHQEAIDAFRQSLSLDPANQRAIRNLSRSYLVLGETFPASGNVAESVRYLQQAIAVNPDNPDAKRLLEQATGQPYEAKKSLAYTRPFADCVRPAVGEKQKNRMNHDRIIWQELPSARHAMACGCPDRNRTLSLGG